MRTRFIKYGKSVKLKDGSFEHAEISIDLDPTDYEEAAFDKAKKIVKAQLVQVEQPLRASIGDMLKGKQIEQ